ncbi:hypothetical protein [Photorhabdus sp. SF281]|uniref:hypothetical protein n=1 Tax=Photorhabdus sp. SF281 TaxID=3459527 RepID=UPI004044CFA9
MDDNNKILTLRGLVEKQPSIKVIPKKDNAKNRRLAKQIQFWDRKRAEYEVKPVTRRDRVKKVLSVQETKVYASVDNRCLPNTWLYSVR